MVKGGVAGPGRQANDLEWQIRERALLYEIQRSFSGIIDLDELLPVVISRTKAALGVESSAILLVDPATAELYFPHVADTHAEVERRFATIRIPAGEGIAGWVMQHGETQCVADVRTDPRWYGKVDEQSGMVSESLLCTPLRGRDGVIGVIELRNKLDGEFCSGDIHMVEALADAIGGAIDNALRYRSAQTTEARLREELNEWHRRAARDGGFANIVGQSEPMRRVFRLMESAIAAPVTVLLQGETGTGKELVARAIHDCGPRGERPFIAVNCGGLSETLLESELFGHKKGAFTGAVSDRPGVFEVADNGTIFLDEVGDMPASMQIRLLRVLQEGEVVRLGESIPRHVDVRVISASHRDLAEIVTDGRFRDDLFFRLSTFPIHLPPLRERREDLRLIAAVLLERTMQKFGKPAKSFAPEVLTAFEAHAWPGNVRELQNEIERAAALAAHGDRIEVEHLSAKLGAAHGPRTLSALSTGHMSLKEARLLFEKEYVAQVLAEHRGNAVQAARRLGISRVMLQKKIRAYGLRGDRGDCET